MKHKPSITNEALLAELLPVVNQIHGGCDVCLGHWIDRANAVLAANDVTVRFDWQRDGYGERVVDPQGKPVNVVVLISVQSTNAPEGEQ